MGSYMDSMPLAMGKFFQAMKETTGLDMVDLMAGESKSAQTERNIHIDGASAKALAKALEEAPEPKPEPEPEPEPEPVVEIAPEE
jgi:flotillin